MIVSCEMIQRDEFILERGAHPKDSMIIVLSGSFICETRDQEFIICENEMFFFKGGDMFKRKILSPIKAIYIIFDSMPLGVNQKINITNISRINENIVYLINGIKSDDKKTINHFINDITYFCLNEDKEGNSITEKIVHYLQDNFNKAVTLDELSEVFNMSKQWLITLFKKEKGIAPITYLNNYRMKKAKEFLLNQEMNVAEISVACGFETQYYFSNTFKKAFGVSPTTWRKDMLL